MSQASRGSIKDANINLKKSLGQNFLTDSNIVNKIVNTADVIDTTVIEIGPGIGALTEVMLKSANNVIAIEIDQRLVPILDDKFKDQNLEVINEDFLNIDPNDIKKLCKSEKVKVVANLPYYITSAIITKILLEYSFVDELIIMVQKEVAERISASHNSKKYNSLTVFCQTLSDVKYEFTVKKTVFKPIPKVDSAIISFKRKNFTGDICSFEKFVKNCFVQKRKTLRNNLSSSYNIDKESISKFLADNELDESIRSEQIKVNDFFILYEKFVKNFNI